MITTLSETDRATLRKTALFGRLPEALVREVLHDASERHVHRGEVLFVQGDPVVAAYIVLEGWVKIYRLSEQGHEAVVAVFARGESFAEAATFMAGAYPVSAEAVSDGRVLVIPARSLIDKISSKPDISLAMLASCSLHLHDLVGQIEQLKARTAIQRVAGFLLGLCPVGEGACTIGLPYDKTLIAGRLGMTPESLSRAFSRLRPHGVRIEHSSAAIADVARLRQAMESGRGESHRKQM